MSRYSEVLESIFTSENKYTVLQLLKALIDAVAELAGHTVTDVSLTQSTAVQGLPTTVHLTFSFDDDTSETFDVTVPSGTQGISITDVSITSDNELIATFSDGTTESTGRITAAQLYRHVVVIQTDYGGNNRYLTLDIVDTFNRNYASLQEIILNHHWNIGRPGNGSELFPSTGTIAQDGSNVGLMFARIVYYDSTNQYRVEGQSSDYNTYDAYITGQQVRVCYTYPVALAALKGDTGATGPQGPQGETGATGATGPQGPQGIQGEQGLKGDQGYQGVSIDGIYVTPEGTSADGNEYSLDIDLTDPSTGQDTSVSLSFTAPYGPQGPKGDTGDTGPTGPTGPQGPQGETGPQGPQGDPGTMDIIEITSGSGTLSASDLAKIGPNSLIKYTHAGIVDYLAPETETVSINHIYYSTEKLGATRDASQSIEILRIDINKSTGSYTTNNLSPSLLKSDSSGLFNMTLDSVLGISGTSAVKKEDASHFRIPSGGTAGQVLTKVDGTDYNTAWANASGGGSSMYKIKITYIDNAVTVKLFTTDGNGNYSWGSAFTPQINTEYECLMIRFETGDNGGGIGFTKGYGLMYRSNAQNNKVLLYDNNYAAGQGTETPGDIIIPFSDTEFKLID